MLQMSITSSFGRRQPTLVVVADEPTHTDPSSFSVGLEPMYDDVTGLLGGFRLWLSGEIYVTVPLPLSLKRSDLGKSLSICIIAADYSTPRHCLLTCYKTAQNLVKQGLLSFATMTQSNPKETRFSLVMIK